MTSVFLMTDVVGSTAMWEQFAGAMPDLLAKHDQIVHGAVRSAGGTVFKHTGDGMLAVFDDPDAAIGAAHDALNGLNAADWSPVSSLTIRSSIHAGHATQRAGDYFGPTLNRVARINGVANPGQILISSTARQLMSVPAGGDLGEHQLRDLGEPIGLWQLDDGEHPPLQTLQAGLHNLPTQLSEFVGRSTEIGQLTDLLSQHRLISITGVGGCGKTRISLELAASVSDRFAGGVWFVDLRPADSHDQILQQIAAAIGLLTGGEVDSATAMAAMIVEYANRASTLIILDNCEHIIDDAADAAEDLLRGASSMTILATTREALGADGERVWRIPSLSNELGEASALFMARAHATDSEFDLQPGESGIVDEICVRLDGIPLAIELAAARVTHMTLVDLNARLDERFALLSGGRRARRQRQQTLQAMMDWSWDLLDADEQRMLAEVAVFRGGFDTFGIDAVCSPPAGGTRFDVLTSLVDRSLVNASSTTGSISRYQLLETVRLYGLDRLAATGDTNLVRDRHAAWVRGFNSCLRSYELKPDAFDYSLANMANVLAALEWFEEADDPAAVAEIASAFPQTFAAEFNAEGQRWLSHEQIQNPAIPYTVQVAAYTAASQVWMFSGDYDLAHHLIVECLAIIDGHEEDRSTCTRSWEARIHLSAAMHTLGSGVAQNHYDAAMSTWPEGAAEDYLFTTVATLMALAEGDLERVLDLTKSHQVHGQALAVKAVRPLVRAIALSTLGRHEQAVALCRELLSLTDVRDLPIASGIAQLAFVYARAGEVQLALDLLRDPPRLAVGKAVDHWRLGRALLLGQLVIADDPELAANLIGAVTAVRTVTARIRRQELLNELSETLGDEVLDALGRGKAQGEDVVVGRAHDHLTSLGYSP